MRCRSRASHRRRIQLDRRIGQAPGRRPDASPAASAGRARPSRPARSRARRCVGRSRAPPPRREAIATNRLGRSGPRPPPGAASPRAAGGPSRRLARTTATDGLLCRPAARPDRGGVGPTGVGRPTCRAGWIRVHVADALVAVALQDGVRAAAGRSAGSGRRVGDALAPATTVGPRPIQARARPVSAPRRSTTDLHRWRQPLRRRQLPADARRAPAPRAHAVRPGARGHAGGPPSWPMTTPTKSRSSSVRSSSGAPP